MYAARTPGLHVEVISSCNSFLAKVPTALTCSVPTPPDPFPTGSITGVTEAVRSRERVEGASADDTDDDMIMPTASYTASM